jgi:4-hydroxy-tetrahydrodipicolinate synthase
LLLGSPDDIVARMFTGALTALVTPMRDGGIDEPALRRLVDEQIHSGIDGLVAVGTTGESPTLSHQEHVDVVGMVVEQARHRVPVVAGAGSNSTREAEDLSRGCKAAGADGLLQVTPYYNKPTQDGLIRHFATVYKAAPLPTIVYNVPGRTGCDLLPETIERLAHELPGVVGVKEATGNPVRAQQILGRTEGRLTVLSGDDATALSLYAIGARGVISVTSNVTPADVAAMWDAVVAEDFVRARQLHYKLLDLNELLFIESNPIPVKAALAMMGRIGPDLRPPLYPLGEQASKKLRAALSGLGLL